jgi:hypothetical protein
MKIRRAIIESLTFMGCDATCTSPKRGMCKRAKRLSSKRLRRLVANEQEKQNATNQA